MKCPHCKKQIKFTPGDLTRKEAEAYNFIATYWQKNNQSPTGLEILLNLGCSEKSKGYGHRLLRNLEKKGYIALLGGWRNIQVL